MPSDLSAEHLVVFSHVSHYRHHNGTVIAHGGFVREIDIWARIFDRVTVVATTSARPPKGDEVPYSEANVEFIPFSRPYTLSSSFQRFTFWLKIPYFVCKGLKLLETNSIVMARGPDNFGFVGALVGLISRKRRFAKYAGQWGNYDGEGIAYRFQRWFYRSCVWDSAVFANTAPNGKTPKVVSLLNASLSEADWNTAGVMAHSRPQDIPFRLLFVGRISPAKGIDTLIYAVDKVVKSNTSIHLDIVGDGPKRVMAEDLVDKLRLHEQVTFHGWQDREILFRFYSQAHCLVSASRHQGLDKVILEGMAFALPIIGTKVSVMPFLINPPECGVLITSDNVDDLAAAITMIYEQPSIRRQMGENARAKSESYLLERQEAKFRAMLREQLGLQV